MDKLALYTEWKELVKKSKEINARKKEVKRQLGSVSELKNDFYSTKSISNSKRAKDMASLFFEGYTLQEIGDIYGISRERVRQILNGDGIKGSDGGKRTKLEKAKTQKCLADGCELKAVNTSGYCMKHYQRLIKHGNTRHDLDIKEYVCHVNGCDEKHKAKGLCFKHYCNFQYHKRNGNVASAREYLDLKG